MQVKIKVKKNHPEAQLPKMAYATDAGADVHSVENAHLRPGQTKVIDLGFSVEIPPGWEIQVRPRSGLAAKKGVTVLNSPGTVDAPYRGPMKVILHNSSEQALYINTGDRIAQFCVRRVPQVSYEWADELSDTDRGAGGFGSTGR